MANGEKLRRLRHKLKDAIKKEKTLRGGEMRKGCPGPGYAREGKPAKGWIERLEGVPAKDPQACGEGERWKPLLSLEAQFETQGRKKPERSDGKGTVSQGHLYL